MGRLLSPDGEQNSNISKEIQTESERDASTKKEGRRKGGGSQGPEVALREESPEQKGVDEVRVRDKEAKGRERRGGDRS